jgi:hypothetical protein
MDSCAFGQTNTLGQSEWKTIHDMTICFTMLTCAQMTLCPTKLVLGSVIAKIWYVIGNSFLHYISVFGGIHQKTKIWFFNLLCKGVFFQVPEDSKEAKEQTFQAHNVDISSSTL